MHDSMKRMHEVARTKRNSDIARALGVKPSTVTNWATRGVSKEGALLGAEVFNSDANYILNGEVARSITAENLVDYPSTMAYDEANIKIPVYNKYSPEDGVGDCGFTEVVEYRAIPKSFFIEKDIQPANLKLFISLSNAMAPYINKLDDIGIDVSNTKIKDGEIYAVIFGGTKMVRQVFVESTNTLRLRSYNTKFPDKLVNLKEDYDFKIIGKQVYRAG